VSDLPRAPIEPEGIFDGLRWDCIVRGALLDIVLTVVGSVPLILFLAGSDAFSEDQHASDQAIERALTSPEGVLWGTLLGLAATLAGSCYGAWRAGQHHVRHGGWVAVVSLVLALPLSLVSAPRSVPLFYELLGLVGMLPAGLLGGLVARRLQRNGGSGSGA
jgi:hypothetical protein